MTPRIWLIGGPTASGKSALALRLAQVHGAEIVGADSMQLYNALPVLTAAPSADELAQAPHHLIGVAEPDDVWSAGRWQAEALKTIAGIHARGRPAVVVGGTGLYFNTLTKGLTATPQIDIAQRDASTAQYADQGEEAFRAELARLDPAAAARIERGDRQRLIRAHAVAIATGRALTDWQADTTPPLAPGSYAAVTLAPPREALYRRCDLRFERMVRDGGALDEVAALAGRDLNPQLPALKAVGYRELAAHLAGEISLDDAIAQAQMQTRRYAKRQSLWFRNQAPDWPVIIDAESENQWLSQSGISAKR